ncbi:MAG TPA: transporter [Steroidobacteraceae bacterium]|nr:transporter [Steroidobacteraceae bacterium]
MDTRRKWKCVQGTVAAAAFAAAVSISGGSFAAEGGGSSYLQGTYGDFAAAVTRAPGGYLRNDVIYHDAGIGARPINGGLDPGFDQKLWMDRLSFAGFADGGFFGGKFGIEVQIPYVADLTVAQRPGGPPFDSFGEPRDHAIGDPVIKPQLAWGSGPHYSRLSLGIVAPWGTADDSRVVSVGRHYWSFDPAFTYTYLSDNGWDLSWTLGYMVNLENSLPGPNYETGDELHFDALFGKHFGDHFALGIAGYWYSQMTDDKGPIPAPLESGYRSEGAGFGPAFMFGTKNFSVVGKWLTDEQAENRLDGDLYMLSIVARFGGESPPPPMPVAPPVARVEPPPAPPPPPPADADGDGVVDQSDLCPATPRGDRVDVNGCACDVTVQVNFRSNSTQIYGADAITLDSLADQVRRLPTIVGELGGHTDSQGAEAFNVDLSRRRALAARDYLASRGLDVTQLAIAGYGESQPIADNATAEGRALNRRVVMRRTNCQVGP